MTFQEWLPITKRNKVALCLAAASLVMFVGWNCMPMPTYKDGHAYTGIVATSGFWSNIFSPDLYLEVIRRREIEGFMAIAIFLGLTLNGATVFVAIPFWKILQASNYLRIPIALSNLLGGSATVCTLAYGHVSSSWHVVVSMIGLGMFCMAAAFFTFKNELALREARAHGMR